ncbi:ABC transporter ATP-binding protein [Pseudonocardia sp. RS010]|uniref:ABC transporter ATP-binding protein n=1 Tax=Pseudonocardia sp. RS010 TaxID=3385979 RepID=UPI0039A01A7D
MTATATLQLDDVDAEYFPGQPILRGLTLRPEPGEVSVIIGPNGSGKSTALRVLAGLLPPSRGRVLLRTEAGEQDVAAAPAHLRSGLGVSYLPQGHSVFPALSVHDNLVLGGWPIRRSRSRAARAVAAMYDRYPALAAKRTAPAGSLSGGQQRILELARALVPDPSVLLIDEPSAGVAPAVATVMYRELQALRGEGRTVVLVDQDVRAALGIADSVHVLRSGRVDRSGSATSFDGNLDALVHEWLAVGPGRSTGGAA